MASITSMVPSKLPVYTSTFAKASEIPQYCITLAEMFEKQPLFDGLDLRDEKCKVIPLSSWDDARICDIFNTNVGKNIGKSAWLISNFGCGNNQLYDSSMRHIQQGVSLSLYDELERCSLDTLRHSYNRVFIDMITGWASAKIEENPDIMFKQNIEEFFLFIKEKSLCEEAVLIRCIASRFSLENDVKCADTWLKMRGPGYRHDEKVYLWVRKSAIANVIEKCGFQFSGMTYTDCTTSSTSATTSSTSATTSSTSATTSSL